MTTLNDSELLALSQLMGYREWLRGGEPRLGSEPYGRWRKTVVLLMAAALEVFPELQHQAALDRALYIDGAILWARIFFEEDNHDQEAQVGGQSVDAV